MLFAGLSGELRSRYSVERYTHLTETLFARWHRNLTLTLTITLKVKIIYAVKDDTETKLHIVLYLKVIFLGMAVGL